MTPVEDRVAAAVCWLYRAPGLPPSDALRRAVVDRHGLACEWCDFELKDLLDMARIPEDPAARAFSKIPARQQREMVAKAQGADFGGMRHDRPGQARRTEQGCSQVQRGRCL